MKVYCSQMHCLLLQELAECEKKNADTIETIEDCFQISFRFWNVIAKKSTFYTFSTANEEIQFFKEIKPLFTSEIEYYSLLYHAQLFKPDQSIRYTKEFWAREQKRLAKFIKENAIFYSYYKNKDTHYDHLFFKRNNDTSLTGSLPCYNLDTSLFSSHDHLVAQIICLEKYSNYAKGKLRHLFNK